MARCPYVMPRKGTRNLCFRRRVPTDIAEIVGFKFWDESLKTPDWEKANRLGLIRNVQIEAEIARAYRILEGASLSGDEIGRFADDFLSQISTYVDGLTSKVGGGDKDIIRRLASAPRNTSDWRDEEPFDNQEPDLDELTRNTKWHLARLLRGQEAGDFSYIQDFADFFFEQQGLAVRRVDQHPDEPPVEWLDIDRTRADYQTLCRELMEREIASVRRQLVQIAKAEVGHVDPPQVIMAPPATTGATPTELHPDATKTPMELFGKFATYCRDSNLTESTIRNYETAIRRLQEVTKKKAIAFVTRNDVIDCVDLISKAPAKFKTMLKAQTMSESIAANSERAEKGDAPVSITRPTTVNKHLSALRTFFGWAKQRNLIAADPVAEIKGPKKGRALQEKDEDNPKGYTLEELSKIVNMKEFVAPSKELPYRFWVPLCALFTGARMGEVCGLDVDDIREEGGYSWFVITATKTKTRYAVPIHGELKRLGFLEYVAKRRKAGGKKLFPDAPLGAEGRSDYAPVTQWWDHVTTRDGIKRPGKNMHRFRHSFTTAARASEISDSVAQALTGHTSGSTDVHKGYGDLPEVIDLCEKGISKLVYRGLDLSHLYPKS